MKRTIKLFALIALISILIIPMAVQADTIQRETLISVDGKPVQFNSDLGFPKGTNNGRTLVPVRIISEDMGYKVEWENKQRKVTISDDKTKIEFNVGDNTALVNGKKVPMDVREDANGKKFAVDTKAQLIGSRTYVPLRFISETMGATVDWKIEGKVMFIYITRPGSTPVVPPVSSGKIPGNAEYTGEGHEVKNLKKLEEFFGKDAGKHGGFKENGGGITFNPIGGGTDSSFLYVIDRAGEDFEALVVIKDWYKPSNHTGIPTEEAYKKLNPTTKEVLRFYLPNGYEKLYKIIDDGYNFRWDDASNYVGKDLSKMIGSDKKVVLIDGDGGLQIEIGVGK